MSEIQAEIKGHSFYNAPATRLVRCMSFLVDFSIAILILGLEFRYLHLNPIPSYKTLLFIFLTILVLVILYRFLLSASLGRLFWGLHSSKTCILQRIRLKSSSVTLYVVLTLLLTFGTISTTTHIIIQHPLLAPGGTVRLAPYLPPQSGPEQNDWITIPLFYSIGAWPLRFQKQPIFFSLPYEKGPPTRFVGHIIAHWADAEIVLTFEGPKTPPHNDPIQPIKRCFTQDWSSFNHLSNCLYVREMILDRHFEALGAFQKTHWQIHWFEVDNQAIPATERPQGIYLLAESETKIQERYILINKKGIHQTIILDRTTSSTSQFASDLLQKAIGTLRITDELNTGRAWINRQLTEINLRQMEQSDSTNNIFHLIEIQALLLAKISVDPKDHDAFYHLGGNASLLGKKIRELPSLIQNNNNELLETLNPLLAEWIPIIKPMIHSSYLYLKDIAPENPQTIRLQNLWIEAQKY